MKNRLLVNLKNVKLSLNAICAAWRRCERGEWHRLSASIHGIFAVISWFLWNNSKISSKIYRISIIICNFAAFNPKYYKLWKTKPWKTSAFLRLHVQSGRRCGGGKQLNRLIMSQNLQNLQNFFSVVGSLPTGGLPTAHGCAAATLSRGVLPCFEGFVIKKK